MKTCIGATSLGRFVAFRWVTPGIAVLRAGNSSVLAVSQPFSSSPETLPTRPSGVRKEVGYQRPTERSCCRCQVSVHGLKVNTSRAPESWPFLARLPPKTARFPLGRKAIPVQNSGAGLAWPVPSGMSIIGGGTDFHAFAPVPAFGSQR